MARDRIIELTLEKAEIALPGGGRGATKRMVIVTLVCPRPRIAEKVASRTVEFRGGELDMSEALWMDRIVMKDLVSGQFGMRVAVTDRVVEPLNSDFLRLVGAGLLKAAGVAADKAVAEDVGGDLAKLPFTTLSKMVAEGKTKGAATAASGKKDLLTDRLLKAKGVTSIKVPLEAERDFYVQPGSKGAARKKKRRRVLKKGDACGSVTLKAKVYRP
jgi:hypothetical protein